MSIAGENTPSNAPREHHPATDPRLSHSGGIGGFVAVSDELTLILLWTLQKGPMTMRCDIRKSPSGDGFDVQIVSDNSVTFSQRCLTAGSAVFLATSIKHEKRRDGWTAAT